MSVLGLILSIIALIVLSILIAAAFAPNNFSVQSEMVIDKPVATVFDDIKYLKNQEHYNKWVMQDPNMQRTFTGTDGTVGCIYYWDSKMGDVGKGEQEITQIDPDVRIDWIIRFEKPFKNQAGAYMETTALSAGTSRVKWVFLGNCTYMMKVIHIVFRLQKRLTDDLTTSLTNLKRVLEQ